MSWKKIWKWQSERKIYWHFSLKHRLWLRTQKSRWNPWLCWVGHQWGWRQEQSPSGTLGPFCRVLQHFKALLWYGGSKHLMPGFLAFSFFPFRLFACLLFLLSLLQMFLAKVVCFHILVWILGEQEVVGVLFVLVLFCYPLFAWASFTAKQIYCLLLAAIFLFIGYPSPQSFPYGSPFSIVFVLYLPPKILKHLWEDEAFNLIFHLQLVLY